MACRTIVHFAVCSAAVLGQVLHPECGFPRDACSQQGGSLVLLQTRVAMLSGGQSSQAKVPWVMHSSGSSAFLQRTLAQGVSAWSDADKTYTDVPEEMLGATLFAGKRKGTPAGNLTISSPAAGYVYLWGNRVSRKRNPLTTASNWDDIGTMNSSAGKLRIYRRSLDAGQSLNISLKAYWVGGVAFKNDARAAGTATGDGLGDAPGIPAMLIRILKRTLGKLAFNCNTAAFAVAGVLLGGFALGLLTFWTDVERLSSRSKMQNHALHSG